MTRRRPLAAGVVIAAVYVAVTLLTPRLTGRAQRPLFDGFAPPAAYAWVNPPAEFVKGNKKPDDASQDVTLDKDGSVASNATTADGQAIAGLDNGSAPVHLPDTAVRVKITAVDPGTLGVLPGGLRPEGNAYEVTFTDQPSGQVVSTLAKPGTIALTAAGPPTALLFSPDGKAWQDTKAKPFGASNGLFAQLTAPGYYVPTSHNAARSGTAKSSSSGGLIVLVVLGVAVVGIGAVSTLMSSKRRRQQKKRRGRGPSPGPGSGRRRPPGS